MPVYDDEKTEAEQLSHTTGLGKEDASAHAADKKSGASFYKSESKTASRDQLGAAESASGASDQVGLGHNPDDNDTGRLAKLGGFFWGTKVRKRSTIGGGVAALLLGGGFGFLSIASGPLQFLKIASDLENFHFFHLQEAGDERSSGIMRDIREFNAIKNKGGWERTRMGKIGNAVADKFEVQLNASGIEYTTTAGGLLTTGVQLDPEKVPELNDMSPEEAAQYLKNNYGIKDVQIIDNPNVEKEGAKLLKINIGDISSNPLKFHQFSRALLKNAGYNALSQRIGARFLDARYKLSWHYLSSKLTQKAGEAYDAWKKRMNQNQSETIEEGTSETGVQNSAAPCNEGDAECESRSTAAASETSDGRQLVSDGQNATTSGFGSDALNKLVKNIADKLTSKTAAGVGGLIAALCILKSFSSAYNSVKMAEVIVPLVRFATEYMSIGSQIQSGQDLDSGQLGYYSQAFYDNSSSPNDPNAGTSWTQAQTQSAEEINAGMSDAPSLNSDGTIPGVPADNTLQHINSGNPLDWVDSIPGLGAACSSIGGFIVGMLGGGPVGAAIGTVLSNVLEKVPAFRDAMGSLVNTIVGWMVGAPVSAFPSGAQTGNYLNYGARLAANAQAVTSGGGALSQTQVAQLDQDENQQLQQQFTSNSFADRVFNPYTNGSLLNRLATNINPSITTSVTSVASNITGIFGSLTRSLSSLVSSPSYAAGSVNLEQVYGFPEYGFSEAELDNSATSDPYQNSVNAANLLDAQCTDKNGNPVTTCGFITKAAQCFGVNIVGTKNSDGSNEWDAQVGNDPNNNPDLYGGSYPAGCNSDDSDWLTIRFFIFDTETMKSLGCYEGDDDSCNEIFNGATSSSTSNTTAINGTAQSLASQILANPNINLTCYSQSVKQDVEDASNGQPGTSGKPISAAILSLIATVGVGHKVCITAIESGGQGHASNSAHYTGDAVDFGSLDGTAITGRNAPALTIMRIAEDILPSGSAFGQSQCGATPSLPTGWTTFQDTCNHLHVQVPAGTS